MTGDQNHLVIGGTGRVGQEVLRALIARGLSPRALVRSEARAAALPEGAVPVVGDLSDRASLERAIDGIDGVFFITPHHDEDEAWGHNVLDVCEATGVSRVVFSTAHHPDSSNRLAMKMIFVFLGLVLPHYKSKWKIEARVRSLTMNWNVLMPSNFYQNDAMFREQILGGVYPQPLGEKGCNRVDCRDVGLAAARALCGELANGAYPIVGPESWSGAGSAQAWSAAVAESVSYAGDDLDAWREAVGDQMNPREMSDFAKTYAAIQRFGAPAKPAHIARCEQALGRRPTPYRDYIAHQLELWTGEG